VTSLVTPTGQVSARNRPVIALGRETFIQSEMKHGRKTLTIILAMIGPDQPKPSPALPQAFTNARPSAIASNTRAERPSTALRIRTAQIPCIPNSPTSHISKSRGFRVGLA